MVAIYISIIKRQILKIVVIFGSIARVQTSILIG